MTTAIRFVRPGVAFTQPETGIRGTLLHVNECRAHVKLEGEERREVEVTNRDGSTRSFTVARTRFSDWSPNTLVTVQSTEGSKDAETRAGSRGRRARAGDGERGEVLRESFVRARSQSWLDV